jgi:hypothetical protein
LEKKKENWEKSKEKIKQTTKRERREKEKERIK